MFRFLALHGSWEPPHSLKMMPQGVGTFSTIENPILRTFICWSFFGPRRFCPPIFRPTAHFTVSESLPIPTHQFPDPSRKMRDQILLRWSYSKYRTTSLRAELLHFPSKNLPDSPFQRGGELISSDFRFFPQIFHFCWRSSGGLPGVLLQTASNETPTWNTAGMAGMAPEAT